MKHLFLILTGCFIFLISKAQSPDSLVLKQIRDRVIELKTQGIKLPVSYYVDCVGYRKVYDPADPCTIFNIRYLFWKSVDGYYAQRFDNCYKYEPIKTDEKLVDIIADNLSKIKRAKLENPKYAYVSEGKERSGMVLIDHSCHHMFEIFKSNGIVVKDIDDFDLETKVIDISEGKYPNLNYEKNQRSILARLKEMAEVITDQVNKKAPF